MSATLELDRFVLAQEDAGTYERAVAELRAGRKRSHWMWFVFPQVAGLGRSAMSQRYAIASIEEAIAYLEHPVLGTRLLECARIVSELQVASAQDVFGVVDTLKLHSSMTLFARAARATQEEQTPCHGVLARYFDGARDAATERILDVGAPS
jgi:uncharacterized protein (DUF1810 family)